MSKPNFASKTVWAGDNIEIMRGMNSECIDLIYLDPPFNSNANYAAPVGSFAAGAAFKDTWTLTDIDTEWINLIEQKHSALHRVLLAAMTKSDKSYLAYMTARLLEMRRILKSNGSIWLHCDPTMSHYLKMVMDAIFGRKNFRNEIIWKRTTAHSDAKGMGAVHDVILRYTKTDEYTWNQLYEPYDDEYMKRFKHTDPDGRRYMDDNLTAKGLSGGGYEYEFEGRSSIWRVPEETMRELHDGNRLYFTSKNTIRIKRYLDEMKGLPLSDLWTNISPINSQAKEKVGYPTQKPLALLERIIKAGTNEGDIVLDPFCGCATTCVAADNLHREWAGIDISPKAGELVRLRLSEEADGSQQALLLRGIDLRTDIPRRSDLGKVRKYNSPQNKKDLYGEQAGHCAGCGVHFEYRNLTVDHIIAQDRGGTDHIENLQLLCGSCNSIKGNRGMDYLQAKLQLGNIGKA